MQTLRASFIAGALMALAAGTCLAQGYDYYGYPGYYAASPSYNAYYGGNNGYSGWGYAGVPWSAGYNGYGAYNGTGYSYGGGYGPVSNGYGFGNYYGNPAVNYGASLGGAIDGPAGANLGAAIGGIISNSGS